MIKGTNKGRLKMKLGVEDDDYMVTSDTQIGKRYQYERRDNPGSLIYRIGYTIDEVKNIIGNEM